MAKKDSQQPDKKNDSKYILSRILFAVLVISNIYLIYRVSENNIAVSNYNAGYSQRTGVGQFDSFWTKYIGGSKSSVSSYEDKLNTAYDSKISVDILLILDVVLVGAIYYLNRKPKPAPVEEDEDDWRFPRRSRRVGDKIRSRRR